MITIEVEGTPRPQGSKRHVGRGIMIESSKHVADWRSWVRLKAQQAMDDKPPIGKPAPVFVSILFGFDRPKSHLRKGVVTANAPIFHTGRPDSDKLLRAVLDAMTGIVFQDDSQVQIGYVQKEYMTAAKTTITIETDDNY